MELYEGGGKGRGLIAAPTSSTVADYATTGVSGQENVLFLFYAPELLGLAGGAATVRRLLARLDAGADQDLQRLRLLERIDRVVADPHELEPRLVHAH